MCADFSTPSLDQRRAEQARPGQWAIGRQRWRDLLFAHWRVSPAAIQATLPPGLMVDTFEGDAFIGIVPFFMERVRPVLAMPLPWLSWFLELNVRTYVHDQAGRPGVWFYSLDCNQPIAVALARRFFHLPYEHAHMSAERAGSQWRYQCQRRGMATSWACEWSAPSLGAETVPGTLEFFLVERYTLFAAARDGRVFSGRVHHAPYRVASLDTARVSVGPAAAAGFGLQGPAASLLASPGVDVEVFPLQPVSRS